MDGGITIRELREDDDFEAIRKLIDDTMRMFIPKVQIYYGGTAEMVKQNYAEKNKAFLAEENGQLRGFMGCMGPYNAGVASVQIGFQVGYEHLFERLLEACEEYVREKGGTKLTARSYAEFGQIRNPMITLFERMGFVADQYLDTSINMDMSKWVVPDQFDNSGIEPAEVGEVEELARILNEDGEEELARRIRYQYGTHPNYSTHNPDHVILTLKLGDSGDIAAIAYYQVVMFKKGEQEKILALGLFVHFRHGSKVDRTEKRRFLQGVFQSMKQLGISRAMASMTFRDFETFTAIAAECYYWMSPSTSAVNLTKSLQTGAADEKI
ncbi:GNAT family N-acetyltransferase [Paenibacillus mesophilus]|uniref:GNAT family N-acetyltransferase n=1 Tax=Paenibacillus mesophilus TaxID=2582849 RepID=UPI00110D88EA|nr:GNAT family N-acetyltransferase [Paenibacillus mesophilus]TMV51593.1 GNAT family N-acetyltransferase [Paenibacillus mesophilus]